jgi:hypothetical protein
MDVSLSIVYVYVANHCVETELSSLASSQAWLWQYQEMNATTATWVYELSPSQGTGRLMCEQEASNLMSDWDAVESEERKILATEGPSRYQQARQSLHE